MNSSSQNMLLIYCDKTTPRIKYVFREIFQERFGMRYTITNDPEMFAKSELPKLNYSERHFPNEIFIASDILLYQNNIINYPIKTGVYQNTFVLFPTRNKHSLLPYDVFSAVFYMLSRYEEYLPFSADEHGRFEATNALAYKHNVLHLPITDIWIQHLREKIDEKYPRLIQKKPSFKYIPTYDIDIAYAYKYKGFKRTLGGIINDTSNFHFLETFQRIATLLGISKDPYDTYDFQFHIQNKYNLKPIYFFHPGTYGKYDKNCNPNKPGIKKLLQKINQHAEIGIHPSYASVSNPILLNDEINTLEFITGKKITKARQHYIRLILPDSYRIFSKQGITDDYSMGFATEAGFRAGTAHSFHFFNLAENIEYPLKIHPFVLMDQHFLNYTSLQDFMDKIYSMINVTKKTGGEFITVLHNNTFTEKGNWKGWRNTYEQMIKHIFNDIT